jgi:hypothetical protein
MKTCGRVSTPLIAYARPGAPRDRRRTGSSLLYTFCVRVKGCLYTHPKPRLPPSAVFAPAKTVSAYTRNIMHNTQQPTI